MFDDLRFARSRKLAGTPSPVFSSPLEPFLGSATALPALLALVVMSSAKPVVKICDMAPDMLDSTHAEDEQTAAPRPSSRTTRFLTLSLALFLFAVCAQLP